MLTNQIKRFIRTMSAMAKILLIQVLNQTVKILNKLRQEEIK